MTWTDTILTVVCFGFVIDVIIVTTGSLGSINCFFERLFPKNLEPLRSKKFVSELRHLFLTSMFDRSATSKERTRVSGRKALSGSASFSFWKYCFMVRWICAASSCSKMTHAGSKDICLGCNQAYRACATSYPNCLVHIMCLTIGHSGSTMTRGCDQASGSVCATNTWQVQNEFVCGLKLPLAGLHTTISFLGSPAQLVNL